MTLHCPSCDVTTDPALVIRAIAVCGNCGASLTTDGARAKAIDIEDLTPVELKQLTKARAALARPERRQS